MQNIHASRRKFLLSAMKFFELSIMVFCLYFAMYGFPREINIPSLSHVGQARIDAIEVVLFACAIYLWKVIFSIFNLYSSRRLSRIPKEILDVFRATMIGTALIMLTANVLQINSLTLNRIFLFWCGSFSVIVSSRVLLRYLLRRIRTHGRNLRHVLIIGTNPRAIQLAKKLISKPEIGYRFVGFVDDQWIGIKRFKRTDYQLVCDLNGFQDFLRERVVDEVIVALPLKSFYDQAYRIIAICEEQGVIIRYLSNIFDVRNRSDPRFDSLESYSVIKLSRETIYGYPSVAKRLMDITLATILLIILFPIFIAMAVAIKITSPGPILFIQERVGYGKRIFRLYKFRTMVANAERQQTHIQDLNEASGPVFKIKNDPRITPIGKYLRKFSIDELPQLINVVKGDMSIVGPRPLPVRDYKGFSKDWHRRRFSVRPGITCLWQVNGRCKIQFEEWMKLDMEYIDHWSLWLDLKILLKTIPAVFRGIGAA